MDNTVHSYWVEINNELAFYFQTSLLSMYNLIASYLFIDIKGFVFVAIWNH